MQSSVCRFNCGSTPRRLADSDSGPASFLLISNWTGLQTLDQSHLPILQLDPLRSYERHSFSR
ncbi:hypothetical protein CRENBAI_000489, partial [Crenichthys baileyi]